jgi:hypothetical protein
VLFFIACLPVLCWAVWFFFLGTKSIRRLMPSPVSGDGPELYDKRGFGPHRSVL